MKKLFHPVSSYIRQTDWILWILCLSLSGFSILLLIGVLESGYAENLSISGRNIYVQIAATFIGIVFALVLSKIDYKILTRLWKFHVPASYILLAATFIWGVGVQERPDDKRWLVVPGVEVNFQPAELLRISFILAFSYHIYKVYYDINRPRNILGLLIHCAVPVVLIHLQGDDGSALMCAAIAACMLFAAGVNWRYILSTAVGIAVLLPVLWYFVLSEFQKLRILALINQSAEDTAGSYFQQHWAKIALASGGAGGIGIFNVTHTYVPAMHNDFIFSFLGESLGFVGCLFILLIILTMWIKVLMSAGKAVDIQGKMICMGVFAMLSFQSAVNIGMNISLLPVIGNTLPFLSYGGSSVLISYLGVGLVLSVFMHSSKSMFDEEP